jgi:hypothetical protein
MVAPASAANAILLMMFLLMVGLVRGAASRSRSSPVFIMPAPVRGRMADIITFRAADERPVATLEPRAVPLAWPATGACRVDLICSTGVPVC